MNKIILLSLITSVTLGCAKSSDLESLGKRVTGLEEKMSGLEADISSVKSAVADAANKAKAAEAAANRAAEIAQETNSKINNILKQNCDGKC